MFDDEYLNFSVWIHPVDLLINPVFGFSLAGSQATVYEVQGGDGNDFEELGHVSKEFSPRSLRALREAGLGEL